MNAEMTKRDMIREEVRKNPDINFSNLSKAIRKNYRTNISKSQFYLIKGEIQQEIRQAAKKAESAIPKSELVKREVLLNPSATGAEIRKTIKEKYKIDVGGGNSLYPIRKRVLANISPEQPKQTPIAKETPPAPPMTPDRVTDGLEALEIALEILGIVGVKRVLSMVERKV